MPSADVAVVGAGLAGLVTAIRLADAGARVVVLAEGNGAIHWAGGPIDVAVAPGATRPADALRALERTKRHPYAVLGADVAPALEWFQGLVAAGGLPYVGSLEAPYGALPTGIGGTRPVSIVPEAQAAALEPWGAGRAARRRRPRRVQGLLAARGGGEPEPARGVGRARRAGARRRRRARLARSRGAAEPQRAADRRGLRRPLVARRGTRPDRPGGGRDRARPAARRVAGRPRPAPPSGGPGRGGRTARRAGHRGAAGAARDPRDPPARRAQDRAAGARRPDPDRRAGGQGRDDRADGHRGRHGRGDARAGHAGRGARPRDRRGGRRRARRRARGRHPRDDPGLAGRGPADRAMAGGRPARPRLAADRVGGPADRRCAATDRTRPAPRTGRSSTTSGSWAGCWPASA